MNLTKCRRCGADVKAGHHATNKRFCSTDCYETWWNEFRSQRLTVAQVTERIYGPVPKVALDDVRCAWLAALIDGEGTIGIWRERRGNTSGWHYRPVIQVVNTNQALLDKFRECVDGFAHRKDMRKRHPKHKPSFAVTVNRRAVRQVLEQIRPWLVAKRKQADVVIEFCRVVGAAPWRASRQHDIFEALYQEAKALNKRGVA